MAYTLQTIKNAGLDSIKGRKLSLDKNGFLGGMPGVKVPIEDFDESTGSTAVNYGVTRTLATGTSLGVHVYTLQAPEPGVEKTIFHAGGSTCGQAFSLSGSAIVQGASLTSVGATGFNLNIQNAYIKLLGISTAIWLALDMRSSGNASSAMYGVSFSCTASS